MLPALAALSFHASGFNGKREPVKSRNDTQSIDPFKRYILPIGEKKNIELNYFIQKINEVFVKKI